MVDLRTHQLTTQQQTNSDLRSRLALLAVVCLSSGMSVVIYSARVWYTGSPLFGFLIWNLFLAWIPLVCAAAAWALNRTSRRTAPLTMILLGCWLLFFPNAPYLLTDLIHLRVRPPVPLWYDAVMLLTFVWNGLLLGFLSLAMVQGVIESWFGRIVGWLTVLLALGAGGFGMYMGRFLRWNSWDMLFQPRVVVGDILDRIVNPLAHPQTVAVTMLFFGFLTVAYLTMTLFASLQWNRPGDPRVRE